MSKDDSTKISGRTPGRVATAPRAEQPRLHVNVGIDFGTSSSKVIFTGLKLEPTYVCVFEGNPEGYPPICYPSAVRIVEGRVFFGAEAERRKGGTILRSFKTCMSCVPVDGKCRTCSNPLTRERRAGLIDTGPPLAGAVSAEEVATWYLAHLVRKVSRRVATKFPHHQPYLTFQTAAPVKSCDSLDEKMGFQRALELAIRMAQQVEQGMGLVDLHEAYRSQRERMEDDDRWLEKAEERTFVLPETHAALVAFIKSTQAEDGLYSIIDVGAGTSDISFFRYYHDSDGQKTISYYCSDVSRIGGDAIDLSIYDSHPANTIPYAAMSETSSNC